MPTLPSPSPHPSFGELLRRLRVARGLTQERLATIRFSRYRDQARAAVTSAEPLRQAWMNAHVPMGVVAEAVRIRTSCE